MVQRNRLVIGVSGLLVLLLVAIVVAIDPQGWRIGALAAVNFALAIAAFASFGRATQPSPRLPVIGRSGR